MPLASLSKPVPSIVTSDSPETPTTIKFLASPSTEQGVTTNDLYDMWAVAEESQKPALWLRMRRLLLYHAGRVCWKTLHRLDTHLVTEMVDDLLLELDQFKGESKFSTYAHSRFRYRCIDEYRFCKKNLGESLDSFEEFDEDASKFEDYFADPNFQHPDQRIAITEILDQLPARYRAVVEARLDGYTFEDIAQSTGMSDTTVRRIWKEVAGEYAQD